MRKLKVKDIAPATKLLSFIDIKPEIEKIVNAESDPTKVGIQIFGSVLKKYGENPKAEKALANFLSGPFEMEPEAILDMDIDEFIDAIKKVGGMSAFINFFGSALQ